MGTSSIYSTQLSRFYLKTKTECSLRNVVFSYINNTVFLDIDRKIYNVHEYIIFIRMCCHNKLLDLIYCNIILYFTGQYSKYICIQIKLKLI
jgi:hypothetical protein